MQLERKYKLIGKKKYATIERPITKAAEIFLNALKKGNGGLLQGKFSKEGNMFKVFYKVSDDKKDFYENYYLLVELEKVDENTTKIQYCFVYDKMTNIYTKILSIICFLISGIASAVAFFKVGITNIVFHTVLLIVSAFGIISLFAYKEKLSDVEPMVNEFEKLLVDSFSE